MSDRLVNLAGVVGGSVAGYVAARAIGQRNVLYGVGALSGIGLVYSAFKPVYKRTSVNIITAAISSALVTSIFTFGKQPVAQPSGPSLPNGAARLTPVSVVGVNRVGPVEQARIIDLNQEIVETPTAQVSIDPAKDNAITACSEGINDACCWLEANRNVTPPRACVRSVVSGLRF